MLSTDDVGYDRFGPHGHADFAILKPNIMMISTQGPFNGELIKASAKIQIDLLVKTKEISLPWADIITVRNSWLAIDELFDNLLAHLKELQAQNIAPVASATVFDGEVEGVNLMMPKYQECYDEVGIHFETFRDQEKALAWVRQYLPVS